MKSFMSLFVIGLLSQQSLAAPPSIESIEKQIENSKVSVKSNGFSEIDKIAKKLSKSDQERLFRSVVIDPRIVGGNFVQIADYPWQVALIAGYAQMRLQFCGGTLIRRDIVVTAAHCVDNNRVSQNPSRVDIVAGTSLYAEGGERKKVTAILVHPNWNPQNMDNDVAILLLDSEVEQGKPVLLDSAVTSIGAKPTVTGWGALFEGGRSSEELMGVAIPVIDNSVCNSVESYQKSITNNMLCAGERDGGKDSCQGDSGGPLVLGTKNEARLVGIVSWGEGCARKDKYGVYTRVSSVYDWIYSSVAAVRPEKISTTSGGSN